ncbi:MAG: hypothetical protein RLZZ579_974 [Actinomycetota bacterium]|jgi:hypothetical protein
MKLVQAYGLWKIGMATILSLLMSGLTPLTSVEPAEANFAGPRYLQGFQISHATQAADFFPAFGIEVREYYINIYDHDFSSNGDISLQLDLEADTYFEQILFVGCTTKALPTSDAGLTKTLALSTADFASGCAPDPLEPTGSATLTLRLHSLSDWQSAVPNTPYTEYVFHIIYRLGNDSWNFAFNELNDFGHYLGAPAISSRRQWVQVPTSSSQTKSGFVFGGFRDRDTEDIYLPGEPILLDRDFDAFINWIEDVPSGTLTLEGIPYNFGDPDIEYVALDVGSRLDYEVEGSGDYVIRLFDSTGSAISAFATNQNITISGIVGTPSGLPTNPFCSDPDPAVCNIFTLTLTIYSPSGTSSTTSTYKVLRRTNLNQVCAGYESINVVLDVASTTSCQLRQDWIIVDAGMPDDIVESNGHTFFLHKYTDISNSASIAPQSFYPLFEDTTFVAIWEIDNATPSEITLFGNRFQVDVCLSQGPNPQIELCLQEIGGGSRLFRQYDETFYLELEFIPSNPLASSQSHTYPISFSMAVGSSGTWNLFSVCCDPNLELSDERNLEDNPAFDYQASEICTDSGCARVFTAGAEFASFTEELFLDFDFEILRIYPQDSTVYTMEFDLHGAVTGSQPVSISATASWVIAPEVDDYEKPGFMSMGWSALDNWTLYGDNNAEPIYGGSMVPLIEDLYLYNAWYEAHVITFYAGQNAAPHHQFTQFRGFLDAYQYFLMPTPVDPQNRAFIGWGATQSSSVQVDFSDLILEQDTNFYAIWGPLANQVSNNPQPHVISNPAPVISPPPVVENPAPVVEILLPKPKTTSLKFNRINGISYVDIRLPYKYAGKPSTFEVKRFINGRVRYIVLSTRKSTVAQNEFGEARSRVLFSFKVVLKPTDTIRVKVAGVEVMNRKVSDQ